MSKKYWMLAAGALAFAACGEGGGSAAEGETGSLKVTVHDMTEAQVEELHLTIAKDTNVPGNRAVDQGTVVLTRADVTRTQPGAGPIQWEFDQTNLPIGTYLVTAYAYNTINPLPTDDPTFVSDTVTVTVLANQSVDSHIFLRQDIDDGTFKNPVITSVTFGKKPEFGTIVPITVTGSDGEGALALTATGDGFFGDATTDPNNPVWNGQGTGNAATGGAAIDWSPEDDPDTNVPGNQTVKITLTDDLNNSTSLTMQIFVDYQRGDVAFTVQFNHAPTIEMEIKIDMDKAAASTTVEMRAGYTDAEYPADPVKFTWELSNCIASRFSLPATPNEVPFGTWDSGNGRWEGTLDGDGDKHLQPLLLTATNPANSGNTCTVQVTVEDNGLKDGSNNPIPGTVSKRTQTFEIVADWINEVVP